MRLLLLACLLTCSFFVFADIIPDNSHYLERCVKIVNIDSFPEVTIMGYYVYSDQENIQLKFIKDTECIERSGYDFMYMQVCAVNNIYMEDKKFDELVVKSDQNLVLYPDMLYLENGFIDDSIPYQSITEEYRILGFSEYLVYMYKHKEIISFNNDQADSITYFKHTFDTTRLEISIPLSVSEKRELGLEIYPNPASEVLNIHINNVYEGEVLIKLYAQNGQLVLSQQAIKSGNQFNNSLNTSNLVQGVYYLELHFGDNSWTEKVVIK